VPLDEYLDEVMDLLKEQPTPREIVVEAAQSLRYAERDGTYADADGSSAWAEGFRIPAITTDDANRQKGTVMSLATLLDRNQAFADTGGVAKNPQIPFIPNQQAYIITCLDPRTEPAAILGVDLGDAIVHRVPRYLGRRPRHRLH
jgi:hypothetical protein